MGFLSDIFGSEQKQKSSVKPRNIRTTTGLGSTIESLSQGKGKNAITNTSVNLPSIIAERRAENLAGLQQILSQLQGGRGEIIDAAISPLITRRDDALGATARDLGRRGVSGSLRGDALANVDTRFGEAIADARGRATSQQVASEAGLFQLIDALNQEELAQELSSLGLSSAAISAALAGGARKGTASSFDPAGSIGNLLFGVGSILP